MTGQTGDTAAAGPPGSGLPGPGALAPDFAWEEGGAPVTLHGRRGVGPTLLFFYPLAFAPVCRKDLEALDAAATDLGHPRVRLLAVSVDREPQARRFFASLALRALVPVPDPELRVARAYGVGRREGVTQRATVLVDEHGRIAHAEVHSLCFPRSLEALRAGLSTLRVASPSSEA